MRGVPPPPSLLPPSSLCGPSMVPLRSLFGPSVAPSRSLLDPFWCAYKVFARACVAAQPNPITNPVVKFSRLSDILVWAVQDTFPKLCHLGIEFSPFQSFV